MSEGSEITSYQPKNTDKHTWLPSPFKKMVTSIENRRQEKQVLSENEKALNRMSEIAWKVRDLVDNPEFRQQEEIVDQQIGEHNIKIGHSSAKDSKGQSFSIHTMRDKDGKVDMFEVYESPSNLDNYSTGQNDGYFRFYFSEDHFFKPKNGEKTRLTWGNTSMHGEKYLGKEITKIIDDISVDNAFTRVSLKGVDFGGHPSIHVSMLSANKDSKGNYIGPIGKINELWVQGIARAIHPVGENIMESNSIQIPVDGDFNYVDKPFVFDRGEIKFEAKKINDPTTNKECLAFVFSGIRERFGGDRNRPNVDGPEQRKMILPMDFTNGNNIIDLFEKATDEVIMAYKETQPKLAAKNDALSSQ